MISEESVVRALVVRLRREYRRQTGFFARYALPEYDALGSLSLSPRERALFLTLSVAPFHPHPSGEPKREAGRNGLWQVCATLQRQHSWAFEPETVVDRGPDRLARLLDRLDVMDDYDAQWWYTCAETLCEAFGGDPRALFVHNDYVASHVARDSRRYALPGIGDVVTTPFWLRLFHDQIHRLSGVRWLPMAVDYRVFQVTAALGGLELSVTDRDDRRLVSDFWTVFCRKHGIAPIAVEKPLRLLGVYWEHAGETYVSETLDDIGAGTST